MSSNYQMFNETPINVKKCFYTKGNINFRNVRNEYLNFYNLIRNHIYFGFYFCFKLFIKTEEIVYFL